MKMQRRAAMTRQKKQAERKRDKERKRKDNPLHSTPISKANNSFLSSDESLASSSSHINYQEN